MATATATLQWQRQRRRRRRRHRFNGNGNGDGSSVFLLQRFNGSVMVQWQRQRRRRRRRFASLLLTAATALKSVTECLPATEWSEVGNEMTKSATVGLFWVIVVVVFSNIVVVFSNVVVVFSNIVVVFFSNRRRSAYRRRLASASEGFGGFGGFKSLFFF